MITKTYSNSLPANPDVTGNAKQVYSHDSFKGFLTNIITAGNAAAIGGTDLLRQRRFGKSVQVDLTYED